MPSSAEDFGLSLIILSLIFAVAALLRRWSGPLRTLFIPTAVIGGFLMLGLGPEGLGRVTGGYGLFCLGATDGFSNIHAPNERVLLDEFEKTVIAEALFFEEYATRWAAGRRGA